MPQSLSPLLSTNASAQSAQMTSAPSKLGSGKVQGAAKEFESILLGEWMQSAETSFASVPKSDDDDSQDGDDQMKSFAVQQLATALTAQGGIGIAQMVSKALANKQDGRAESTFTTHASVSR